MRATPNLMRRIERRRPKGCFWTHETFTGKRVRVRIKNGNLVRCKQQRKRRRR